MRIRIVAVGLVLAAVGLALAGCKNSLQLFQDNNEGGWFSKPMDLFDKPSWSKATVSDQNVTLGPKGPVAPDELVSADGSCSAPPAAPTPSPAAAQAQASAPPPDRPVGSVAGDLASAPMPAAASVPGAPPQDQQGGSLILGGIALGMSECDVVRRAGTPGNVAISAGARGERKVVLTYLSGTWPGIYTFDAGRLKVVDRAPVPETPAQPVKKQKVKKASEPKTAKGEIEREYVQ